MVGADGSVCLLNCFYSAVYVFLSVREAANINGGFDASQAVNC